MVCPINAVSETCISIMQFKDLFWVQFSLKITDPNNRRCCLCYERLQDDAAAGGGIVISADVVLVAVDVVDVRVSLPLVLHLGDGDQFHGLPLGAIDSVTD